MVWIKEQVNLFSSRRVQDSQRCATKVDSEPTNLLKKNYLESLILTFFFCFFFIFYFFYLFFIFFLTNNIIQIDFLQLNIAGGNPGMLFFFFITDIILIILTFLRVKVGSSRLQLCGDQELKSHSYSA